MLETQFSPKIRLFRTGRALNVYVSRTQRYMEEGEYKKQMQDR